MRQPTSSQNPVANQATFQPPFFIANAGALAVLNKIKLRSFMRSDTKLSLRVHLILRRAT
jgi:hypothetical protein